MAESLNQVIRYFSTYEAREEAFREQVCALIPRKHAGPDQFWRDFGTFSKNGFSENDIRPVAHITSNPRDCLAFGTPLQVLAAAKLCGSRVNGCAGIDVKAVADDFNLGGNLSQPVRTLSGGETVKLAIAKAYIAAGGSRKLVVASPFSWLSRANRHCFDKLYDRYRELDLPIDLLALDGEDSVEPVHFEETPDMFCPRLLDFSISLKNVRIPLGALVDFSGNGQPVARVENAELALASPCLFLGENGQGKSLVAKVFARAVQSRGSARINRDCRSGSAARLLFQDAISQTLLRPVDALVDGQTEALGIYREIIADIPAPNDEVASSGSNGWKSLFDIKGALVASRLVGRPAALILDEPDWGLSRKAAIAFVSAVIRSAHRRGVPVILISHKPWWLSIAGSTVQVNKIDGDESAGFGIRLSPGRPEIP